MKAEDEFDNGMGGGQIGPILEKKRLEKGLSLKEVEQATKIRTRYLRGLEREDPTVLPDPVYARGFLKTYANFLGLDGERLARELGDRRAPRRERQPGSQESKTSEFEQPLISPGGIGGAERRRVSGATILTIALAVLVLATVIAVLYFIGSRSVGGGDTPPDEPVAEQPDPSPSQEKKEEPAVAPEEEADSSANDEMTVPETVQVTVRAVGGSSGLTIQVDGTVAADVLAQSGYSQTFEAQRVVNVSAANGGVVEVEVNGRNLGRLGQPGQGATQDFTAESGS